MVDPDNHFSKLKIFLREQFSHVSRKDLLRNLSFARTWRFSTKSYSTKSLSSWTSNLLENQTLLVGMHLESIYKKNEFYRRQVIENVQRTAESVTVTPNYQTRIHLQKSEYFENKEFHLLQDPRRTPYQIIESYHLDEKNWLQHVKTDYLPRYWRKLARSSWHIYSTIFIYLFFLRKSNADKILWVVTHKTNPKQSVKT